MRILGGGRPLRPILLLALGAMFVQQTFAAIGRSLPSVIAPAIMDDLSVDHAWLGVYVGISGSVSARAKPDEQRRTAASAYAASRIASALVARRR